MWVDASAPPSPTGKATSPDPKRFAASTMSMPEANALPRPVLDSRMNNARTPALADAKA